MAEQNFGPPVFNQAGRGVASVVALAKWMWVLRCSEPKASPSVQFNVIAGLSSCEGEVDDGGGAAFSGATGVFSRGILEVEGQGQEVLH